MSKKLIKRNIIFIKIQIKLKNIMKNIFLHVQQAQNQCILERRGFYYHKNSDIDK
jgi:hypothetical protein